MGIFDHRSADPEQQKIMRLARMDAEQLLSRAEYLTDSRYKSMFTTSLEQAMMWFNKAVCHSVEEEYMESDSPTED